jgi:hypothetical protein
MYAGERRRTEDRFLDLTIAAEAMLCEQELGATPRTKYFFVNLPATASMKQLVRLADQGWAIERRYQEVKTELGFDHFEGRSYPGWNRHVVLTAVAYAFLQRAPFSSASGSRDPRQRSERKRTSRHRRASPRSTIMSITADVMWDDLEKQVKDWAAGGLVPNHRNNKSYVTGYGGPNKGNQDINKADFGVNLKKWKEYGATKPSGKVDGKTERNLMYFDAVISASGGADGVWDFKCGIFDDSRTFVYHIIVK